MQNIKRKITAKQKHRKLFKWSIIGFFLADMAAMVVFSLLVAQFFKKKENNTSAKVAVIFFADFDFEKYKVAKDTEKALQKALELHRKNNLGNFICVGGWRCNGQFSGAGEMKNYLIRNGIDRKKILIDSASFDTQSNIRELRKILNKKGITNAALISSPFHLYRIAGYCENNEYLYIPYQYSYCKDAFLIVKQIHHEWLAYIMRSIVPESNYNEIVKTCRNKRYKKQIEK